MIENLFSASMRQNNLTFLQRLDLKLLDDIEQRGVAWAVSFASTNGHTPSKRVISDHPEFKYLLDDRATTEPLNALWRETVDNLAQRYILREMASMQETEQLTGRFPREKLAQVAKYLGSISTQEHITLADLNDDQLYDNADLANNILLGYDYLDQTTGGVLPGEVMLFAARPGVGKSLIVCHQAVRHARLGKRVLVISCEMLPKQLAHRMTAMMGSFNPRLFRQPGSAIELATYRPTINAEMQLIQDAGGAVIFPKMNVQSVATLAAQVHDIRPDLVIIDGVYLLRAEVGRNSAGWETTKAASNGIKQMSLDEGVPVFATTQLKRGEGKDDGFTLDDIAYSDSLGQDADAVIVGAPDAGKQMINTEIVKCRYGQSYGGSQLKLDWDLMRVTEQVHKHSTIKLGGSSASLGSLAP